MNPNVLFADDDSEGTLAPLARTLRSRQHANVKTAVTFNRAIEILENARGAGSTRIDAMLLDIILPFDRNGRGTLMSELGIKLADKAAEMGVRTIAFLTVVRQDEVADRYSQLVNKYRGQVTFDYFDKTELLAPAMLETLLDFVAPPPAKG